MTYKDLNLQEKHSFYELLSQIITEQRRNLLEEKVLLRTNYFIPVIENIHKVQNASAVLRTCDCLGLKDVAVIENNNKFSVTEDISLGANKWLNIHKFSSYANNTKECFNTLRERGYKIVATMPYKNDIYLQDLDINEKAAIVFGSEVDGISKQAIENADIFMKIPMYGFTESFNISVSAAICLNYLTDKIRHSSIDWHLNETERIDTLIEWTLQSISARDKVEDMLIQKITPK